MPTAAELKAELRALRKEAVKPVSRMKVVDVATEIQRLKGMREITPAVASVPSSKNKGAKSSVETIQEAKAKEFPVKPDDMVTDGPRKAGRPKNSSAFTPKPPKDVSAAIEKKKSKLERLMEMMDSDNE